MNWFRDLNIARKLSIVVLVLVPAFAALMLATVIFLLYDYVSFRQITLDSQDAPVYRDVPLVPQHIEGKRILILIVDDNATNRRVLCEMIQGWKGICLQAEDTGEALRVLREAAGKGAPVHAAIVDMMMPGMDGEELGKRIKAESPIAETRLIMLTSTGKRGDAGRLEEIGFAAYLTKPVKHAQLLDCLSVVLQPKETNKGTKEVPFITEHSLVEIVSHEASILLVEDNVVNQKVALKMLQKLGLRADSASNGFEVLEALDKRDYLVVLMDIQMPEMDGMEATRHIRDRENPLGKHTTIIAMTAHAMKGDEEACLAAGMDAYITKPISQEALSRVLSCSLPSAMIDHA